MYGAIGRIYLPRRRLELQARAMQMIRTARGQMRLVDAWEGDMPPAFGGVVTLATRLGDFRPIAGNAITLMSDYRASIDALIADINGAKNHVHLLYYIFAADGAGRAVADALMAAAGRGVKCRVLMDDVGSARGLRRLAPRLRAGGVEVLAALPVGLLRRKSGRIDLRNHRKIAVVDGRIGYAGSQNITEADFVKGFPNEEVVARVTGPVVAHLQSVFLADRYLESQELLAEADVFPEIARGRSLGFAGAAERSGVWPRELRSC